VVGAANGVSKAFTLLRCTAKHDPQQQRWSLRSATTSQAISQTKKHHRDFKVCPYGIQNVINFYFCNTTTKFDVI